MSRRVAFALLSFALATAASLGAQRKADPKADEAAIRQFMDQAVAAHHAGSADQWLKLAADDIVIMMEGSPAIHGKADASAFIRNFFATTISGIVANIQKIEVVGDVAIVQTEERGTLTPKASGTPVPVDMKELLVLRRQSDGSWRAARASLTNNAPNAVPVAQAGAAMPKDEVRYASSATARYDLAPGTPIGMAQVFGDANADAPHGELITFPPNFEAGGWHVHSNTLTLVVIKGAYLYRDENGEKRVGPGEVLHIPGGHRHWSGSDATDGAVFYMHQLAKMDQKEAK